MTLEDLRDAVPDLDKKGHPDKFRIFGWWLHVHKGQPAFTGADIAQCYRELHFAEPTGYTAYLASLLKQGDVLKAGGGFKLAHGVRDKLQKAHGQTAATVKASAALTALATRLPDASERAYFQEAMLCHKHGARRAAVVMAWNIAYAHLCDHILLRKLAEFNAQCVTANPKKFTTHKIATMDDINNLLQESETIAIARDAKIITRNVFNQMDMGLKRRNAAAHPSSVIIGQEQADAHILDMIDNVVLAIY